MRSNSGARATILALWILAASAALIHFTRGALSSRYKAVRQLKDVYFLPSAELTRSSSLGYRAALADILYAHVLVSYGQHFQEKRRFEFVAQYLNAIVGLDPTFREPYRMADTLITLQPESPRFEDYQAARALQERGLKQFPTDSELWLIAGQFSAYLAANWVPEAHREEYRLDGARKLSRSCELISSNQNIPHHCITAARIYSQAGQLGAAQRFLERVLTISEDPEIRSLAGGFLQSIAGEGQRARIDDRFRRLRVLWGNDLRFVSREQLQLLGPGFDPAHCAGPHTPTPDCATTFRDWGELQEDD
jgi:tetratricopeptide (TPR) repeat protein